MVEFPDMWWRSVERFPDRPALVAVDAVETSYAALDGEARAFAARLAEAGVTTGHLVGLRTGDRRRFCVALLGCWLTGAIPVPLSASAPDAYVADVAGHVGAGLLVEDDDTAGDGLRLRGAPARREPGLAYVMHTSGSTGRPKPVALAHGPLAAYCDAFAEATRLGPDDRFLQLAPLTFDVVFEELLPIWAVGGAVVLAPETPEDPRGLLADIERRGVTVAELTTVYWRLLVRHVGATGAPLPARLRLLLVGGEQAGVDLVERSLALGLPIAHVYGVTEAGITSTIEFHDEPGPGADVSVGPPLSNSTIHVVDATGAPVPAGETGEVWIGGASLADGYLGDPAATAARFVAVTGGGLPAGRYYRTGDAGRLSATGRLEVLGRLDDEVKVNGIRVDLTEVEAALAASADVAAAAVVAVPGPDGTQRLHGFVVPAAATDPTPGLRAALTAALPRHLVPESVAAVEALPVTAHGKLDRRALADRVGTPADSGPAAAHPAARRAGAGHTAAEHTAAERLVLAAWTAVLGTPPAGLEQNFADAGGDSLALLALVTTLQESGVVVTSTDCLAHPTVRALAAFLDGGTHQTAGHRADDERRQRREQHLRRRRAANGSVS
ncbi:amino acid adenylation domain-containing protein [Streptomyces sp.]|uniref:amino acid adenylation domain-containing protein n=1 Tax=Streptomyces sp. TaxID=1931 RepID=UPI002F40C3B2